MTYMYVYTVTVGCKYSATAHARTTWAGGGGVFRGVTTRLFTVICLSLCGKQHCWQKGNETSPFNPSLYAFTWPHK